MNSKILIATSDWPRAENASPMALFPPMALWRLFQRPALEECHKPAEHKSALNPAVDDSKAFNDAWSR
jgi:hypothetical protein